MKFPRLYDIYFKLFYSTYINIYTHRKSEEACKSNCVRLRLKRGEARVCHAPSVHTWDQLASERNLFHPKYKQYLIINKLRSRNWKYFRNLQTKSLYVDKKFLVINKHALIHPSVCSYSVVFSKFTLLSKVLHSRTIYFVQAIYHKVNHRSQKHGIASMIQYLIFLVLCVTRLEGTRTNSYDGGSKIIRANVL